MGLMGVLSSTGIQLANGKILSAAFGFSHETEHVYEAFTNTQRFYDELVVMPAIQDPLNSTNESPVGDDRIIKNYETTVGTALGLSLRTWHSDGTAIKTECAVCDY